MNSRFSLVIVSIASVLSPLTACTFLGIAGSEDPALAAFDLRKDVPPSENFDLTDWKLTLPVDINGDGDADEVLERRLSSGWSHPDFFYTDPETGGMVFQMPQKFLATTTNSRFPRTELREMLRAGDLTIEIRDNSGAPNKNNWVLPTVSDETKAKAGGVGGVLRASLAVNQVTESGSSDHIGRIVVGQIHAKVDEPLKLYYRKLPGNRFGSVYYAHEPIGRAEVLVNLIGTDSNRASDPQDGIPLNEVFSYEIRVESRIVNGAEHPMLFVKLIRADGREVEAEPLDLIDSGFITDQDFLYFKAGVYSQNNSSKKRDNDMDRVTFFQLENDHGR